MKTLRIFLVDDSRVFRDAAATLLSTFDGVEIVGQVAAGPEAFEKLKAAAPDLVLMDISMPHMSGIDATARIKAQPDAPCVVLLTSHDSHAYHAAAGADSFVVKDRCFEWTAALVSELDHRRFHAPGACHSSSVEPPVMMPNL